MRFYVLKDPEAQVPCKRAVTDFSDVEPINVGDALKCRSCGDYISGLAWLPPYRAELEVWSNEYGDIAFGPGDESLVSSRFAELYRASGLTGLGGFHEVEITKVIRRGGSKLRKPHPKYFCVTIARSNALINVEASGLVHEEPWTCPQCRGGLIMRTDRVVLEEGTWSGEDIFFPRGLPGTMLASERFKELFDKNRINNGILIPAQEYSFDFYGGGLETTNRKN